MKQILPVRLHENQALPPQSNADPFQTPYRDVCALRFTIPGCSHRSVQKSDSPLSASHMPSHRPVDTRPYILFPDTPVTCHAMHVHYLVHPLAAAHRTDRKSFQDLRCKYRAILTSKTTRFFNASAAACQLGLGLDSHLHRRSAIRRSAMLHIDPAVSCTLLPKWQAACAAVRKDRLDDRDGRRACCCMQVLCRSLHPCLDYSTATMGYSRQA